MRLLGWPLVVLVACAHNVPQDSATGADGKIKGAKPIKLDNGEGVATGIVTYPGGDRVDWKSIALPAGKHGKLDLTMTYVTPRPHLRVTFDVFDQWSTPIAEKAALRTGRHVKTTTIDNAFGTYFIRVYAPKRGDAGKYRLEASFQEDVIPVAPKVDIPDPPRLFAVPPPGPTCDTFDVKNTACADQCPDEAPATWKGCIGKCRTPDVNNSACWDSMDCPSIPDRRVHKCLLPTVTAHFGPCADVDHPDPNNPRCDPDKLEPVTARIVFVEAAPDGAIVTIAVGSNDHVGKSWIPRVLQAGTGAPLVGGQGRIVRIEKLKTVVKVKLTVDQVTANHDVQLSPR